MYHFVSRLLVKGAFLMIYREHSNSFVRRMPTNCCRKESFVLYESISILVMASNQVLQDKLFNSNISPVVISESGPSSNPIPSGNLT